MSDMTTLTDGVRYDAAKLRLVGWIDPDGPRSDTPYLDHHAYIDDDGTYLGPDDEGVEPVFDAGTVVPLDGDPIAEIETILVDTAASEFYRSTHDASLAWDAAGFTPAEITEWVRVGIALPRDADALRFARITPHQVAAADSILAEETGHYVSLDALSEGQISIERLIEVAKTIPDVQPEEHAK